MHKTIFANPKIMFVGWIFLTCNNQRTQNTHTRLELERTLADAKRNRVEWKQAEKRSLVCIESHNNRKKKLNIL